MFKAHLCIILLHLSAQVVQLQLRVGVARKSKQLGLYLLEPAVLGFDVLQQGIGVCDGELAHVGVAVLPSLQDDLPVLEAERVSEKSRDM
jgi:hypothetical protein